MQWMQAIKDRHNTTKHQAKDKLEELGALDQVEGPLSQAVVETQLKRSERTLQGTISEAVTDMNRMVTQQITQAQYREAGPLVKKLLTQDWEEYCGIVSKL